MDLHTPRFTTRETAEAAGFEPSTFRTFLSRGQAALPDDVAILGEKGTANRFNLRMVYQCAIANRLWKAGVDPDKAFSAAAVFAHTGHGRRLPAHVFQTGATLLVYDPISAAANVINSDLRKVNLADIVHGNGQIGVVILVNAVIRDVTARLGIDVK